MGSHYFKEIEIELKFYFQVFSRYTLLFPKHICMLIRLDQQFQRI